MSGFAKVLVDVELGVSEDTARTCLNLVNLYLKNSCTDLEFVRDEDGEGKYEFTERRDGNLRVPE